MKIVVVGAGPAGMAAARTAADAGAEVTMVDSEPEAGGQYLRGRATF
jgi:NADPH-dependent 2,4-dienoyl-CoA reductase/sulfur reductase-like enzyme